MPESRAAGASAASDSPRHSRAHAASTSMVERRRSVSRRRGFAAAQRGRLMGSVSLVVRPSDPHHESLGAATSSCQRRAVATAEYESWFWCDIGPRACKVVPGGVGEKRGVCSARTPTVLLCILPTRGD
eukprot:365846-Chlamydomonas_euryale.AAC.5